MEAKQNNAYMTLLVGITLVVFIACFLWLIQTASGETQKTTLQISELYLRELSEQTAGHFQTSITSYFAQMYTIADAFTKKDEKNQDILVSFLKNAQEINQFAFLAFIDAKGFYHSVDGVFPSASKISFLGELLQGKTELISYDETILGSNMLMLGITFDPISYKDTELIGMFAGMDSSALNIQLSLKKNNSQTYSSIVTKEGGFIINNPHDITLPRGTNVFTKMSSYVEFDNGYSLESIKNDFANNRSGLTKFTLNKIEYYCYYALLPEADWYMMTIIPCALVDASVDTLNSNLTYRALVVLSIVSLTLTMVFIYHGRNMQYKEKELLMANKKAEEARERAEAANLAKSNFLSRMSHEIRTPMNGIMGMTEIARRNLHDPEKVGDCLQKVSMSSQHLLSLINDILDMSKIESGKVKLQSEKFDFGSFLESFSNLYYCQARIKSIRYETILEGDVDEEVVGDSLRLNQILSNLLSNALKFTPEGGSIVLRVSQTYKSNDQLCLHFEVADTGCGIAEENYEKIFQVFEQETIQVAGKFGGTGLGLSIVRSFAHMMDGEVTVKSKVGEGSVFSVDVTLGRVEQQKDFAFQEGMRVLVVSEDQGNCAYISNLFHKLKANVITAYSIDLAEKYIQESNMAKEEIDFCLSDQKLPDGSGMEMVSRIRKLIDKEVPVFLMAYDISEGAQEAKAGGVRDILQKPLFLSSIDKIYQKLKIISSSEVLSTYTTEFDFHGKRILLAEDNELNQEIATELLEDTGALVDTADDGVFAVEIFRKSAINYYDLILMDVQMPRKNGYEAAEMIRAMSRPDAKTIPIFAVTANAFLEDEIKSRKAGMNAHVSKPLDIDHLYQKMKEVMQNNNTVNSVE